MLMIVPGRIGVAAGEPWRAVTRERHLLGLCGGLVPESGLQLQVVPGFATEVPDFEYFVQLDF